MTEFQNCQHPNQGCNRTVGLPAEVGCDTWYDIDVPVRDIVRLSIFMSKSPLGDVHGVGRSCVAVMPGSKQSLGQLPRIVQVCDRQLVRRFQVGRRRALRVSLQ